MWGKERYRRCEEEVKDKDIVKDKDERQTIRII